MTLWLGAFGADVTRSSISTAKSEAQTGPIMGDDPSTWAPALAPEDLERAESGAIAAAVASEKGGYVGAPSIPDVGGSDLAKGPAAGTGIPKVLLYGGAAVAAAGVLYLIFRKKG